LGRLVQQFLFRQAKIYGIGREIIPSYLPPTRFTMPQPLNRETFTWKHRCRSAGYSSSNRKTFSRNMQTFSGDRTDSR